MSAPSQELPALVEVHISVPDSVTAQRTASDLVAGKLAACVQVLGPMASVYTWKDEVHQAQEWLLLAKSTAAVFPQIVKLVREHHRYDVPEVVAVPISSALAEYAEWVDQHSIARERAEGPTEP